MYVCVCVYVKIYVCVCLCVCMYRTYVCWCLHVYVCTKRLDGPVDKERGPPLVALAAPAGRPARSGHRPTLWGPCRVPASLQALSPWPHACQLTCMGHVLSSLAATLHACQPRTGDLRLGTRP